MAGLVAWGTVDPDLMVLGSMKWLVLAWFANGSDAKSLSAGKTIMGQIDPFGLTVIVGRHGRPSMARPTIAAKGQKPPPDG